MSNLTDVLNNEDKPTVENIALGVAYAKAIIDKLFKQKVTITPPTDADVTISADQNLYGYLNLADGSWTTAHNIILDIVVRSVIIDNSNGTYIATVKTSAGTGIAVGAGEISIVYNNGTNVVLDNRFYSKTETYSQAQADVLLALKADTTYVDEQAHKLNGIINGGFDFWDYADSQTTSGYGSDNRWRNNQLGTTKIHSKQASGDTERALFNSKYYSRTVVSSVANVGNFCVKRQRIESVSSYANGKATISFWAKADTSKNIALEFLQNFGTSGSPSAVVDTIGSQLVALTTTWQYFKITVDIPSIVGKTLGTDNNDTLIAHFWFDAGSDFDTQTASLGQQSGTFDIAEVRIDEGEVARPFGVTDVASERAGCQRFYQKLIDVNNIIYNTLSSGTFRFASISLPTTMRAIPTVSKLNDTYNNCTNLVAGYKSKDSIGYIATATVSGTKSVLFDATADAEL